MELFTQGLFDTPGPNNNTIPPPKDSLIFLDLDLKPNTPTKFTCVVCNKPTLSCCMDCKSVFYCSSEHQQQHWISHQYECRPTEDTNHMLPSRSVLRFEENSRKSILGRDRAISRETNDETKKRDQARRITDKSDIIDKSTKGDTGDKDENLNKNRPRKESLIGSEQSLSRKERTKKLQEVLKCYMHLQYDQACLKARKLFDIAKELFETDEEDIFEFLGDGLLLVKCLLTSGNIQGARENLTDLWKVSQKYVSDKKIEWKDENDKGSKLGFLHLKRGLKNFVDMETMSPRKKQDINTQIQKTTNLFSSFAVLFCAMGDFKNCEAAYVRYIKVVENNFGEDSFESSNCYYLMGVFYLEQKYYVKAMACLKKALQIRLSKFGDDEMHESVADCYYNMAIIYKHTQKYLKAMKCLSTAFKVRANLIGEFSLPVAQVLELVGKVIMIQEDYRTAWFKFQECLAIRRKVLNEETHPDIQRVKSLLQDVVQTINSKIHDDSISYGKREALFQLQKEIEGRKPTPDYKIAFTEASRQINPTFISKISFPAESNGLDEDENRSPSKKANSVRTQDFLEVARGQEYDTIQKSETALERTLERSLSKNSGNIKSLNFHRIHSNARTEHETEPYEVSDKYLEVATSVKTLQDRSPAESNKRATFGIITEADFPSQVFLRPDISRLQSSPNINQNTGSTNNTSPSVKAGGGVRKPTKSVTTIHDRGLRGENGTRRPSDNDVDRKKNRKLNMPERFVDSLSNGQLSLLSQLNSMIKENTKERLETLVKQSDFYRSLLNEQKEEFMILNPDLVQG